MQALALCAPPGLLSSWAAALALVAARPEHARVAHRHRLAFDQLGVQHRQQAVGIGLADHEGQVEVVGRLRGTVNALLAERGPNVTKLVQLGAHGAPHPGDSRDPRDTRDTAAPISAERPAATTGW